MIFRRNFGRFFGRKFERAIFSVSASRWSEGIELGANLFFDYETPFCINIALVKFMVSFSVLEIIFDEG